MPTWNVAASESGQKLSLFLKEKLGADYSARRIKQAIEQNACQINGRIERFATAVVGKGDQILFAEAPKKERIASHILYEDEHIVACCKPAGASSEEPSLIPISNAILLHRLDKDTTGVLLWAKTPQAAQKMTELFKHRLVKKTYLAVVDGIPKDKAGHIENHLGRLHQYQGQSLWGVVDKGLLAITDWLLEKKLSRAALVACYPKTGRTHQIRVHLSGLGHPILGDRQYGKRFECSYRPSRCLLHAQKIAFMHPHSGVPVEIVAPIPADLKSAIEILAGK